jgi:hypothetical protein
MDDIVSSVLRWVGIIVGLFAIASVYSYMRFGSLQPLNYWSFWTMQSGDKSQKIIEALPTEPLHRRRGPSPSQFFY